jgi:hypothetical protein
VPDLYFFDSSALVKRYVQEVGTPWIRGLTRRSPSTVINHFHQAVGSGPVTLVSADQALNNAALAEGLAVDDPRSHP